MTRVLSGDKVSIDTVANDTVVGAASGAVGYGIGKGLAQVTNKIKTTVAQNKEYKRIAKDVAYNDHAYPKHQIERGEFPEVTDRSSFEKFLYKTLKISEHVKNLNNGCTGYYCSRNNTLIIDNKPMPQRSTAYRPNQSIYREPTALDHFNNLR